VTTDLAMIVPVRCFSCGKVIGDRWQEFMQRVKNGEAAGEVLESLGINRYCCRRMMLSHVQMTEDLLKIYGKERIQVREE